MSTYQGFRVFRAEVDPEGKANFVEAALAESLIELSICAADSPDMIDTTTTRLSPGEARELAKVLLEWADKIKENSAP